MNERWITLGGALLALVFATGLLFPRFRPAPPPPSRPTSQDAGEEGLLGVYRWLEGAGVPVKRLRTRYTELPRQSPAAAGNLLVLSEPLLYPMRYAEYQALGDWVAGGNSVLVLRADAARPDWALRRTESEVLAAFDIDDGDPGKKRAPVCQAAQPDKSADAKAPTREEIPLQGRIRLLPSPGDAAVYPLLAGVRALEVKPSTTERARAVPREFGFSDSDGRINFVWLCDTARQRTALWQFRHERGGVWISSYADLFGNANLGRADNARLFSNLLGQVLGPGGSVVFDDMHQGDSALYDPEAFFQDPRLHATIGLLLAIWLIYLLGYSNRFSSVPANQRGITPAAFARTVGGFYARSLDAAQAAQAMLSRFHVEARRRLKRPGAGPAWDLLEQAPRVDRALVQALREEQARLDAAAGKPGKYPRDLRRLAALIHQLRESLR